MKYYFVKVHLVEAQHECLGILNLKIQASLCVFVVVLLCHWFENISSCSILFSVVSNQLLYINILSNNGKWKLNQLNYI